MMDLYRIIALLAAIVAVSGLLFHLFRWFRLGLPHEYSPPAGDTAGGIAYSFTGAMNPRKKESASLHMPTYIAGLMFHAGTFLSLAIIVPATTDTQLPPVITTPLAALLAFGACCGVGMLFKRIMKAELRELSTPDDYISNILVTVFQATTIPVLITGLTNPVYYIALVALLVYIPFGKLKHLIYFFAARIHLGIFYGHRGTWPPPQKTKD